jgi:CheY-like chemotaxis protein
VPRVLAVVDDLYFQSRVSSMAKRFGVECSFASVGAWPTDLSGFDLALVDVDPSTSRISAVAEASEAGVPVIAFGPHVDTESRRAAREAGAFRVLAKSKFVTELPRIFQKLSEEVDGKPGDSPLPPK